MLLNENLVFIFFYVDIVAERVRADGHTTEPTTTTDERTTGTNFRIHSIDNGSDIVVFVGLVLPKDILSPRCSQKTPWLSHECPL